MAKDAEHDVEHRDEHDERDDEDDLHPEPLAAKPEDIGKALPGAGGGPHTPPSEAQAPVPPG